VATVAVFVAMAVQQLQTVGVEVEVEVRVVAAPVAQDWLLLRYLVQLLLQ